MCQRLDRMPIRKAHIALVGPVIAVVAETGGPMTAPVKRPIEAEEKS